MLAEAWGQLSLTNKDIKWQNWREERGNYVFFQCLFLHSCARINTESSRWETPHISAMLPFPRPMPRLFASVNKCFLSVCNIRQWAEMSLMRNQHPSLEKRDEKSLQKKQSRGKNLATEKVKRPVSLFNGCLCRASVTQTSHWGITVHGLIVLWKGYGRPYCWVSLTPRHFDIPRRGEKRKKWDLSALLHIYLSGLTICPRHSVSPQREQDVEAYR